MTKKEEFMNIGKIFDLSGRTALVTGSSRGIGKAIAEILGLAGAHVIVHGSRPSETLDATLESFKDMGIKCSKANGDISKTEDNKKLIEDALKEFGKLDILVLNASLQHRQKWNEVTSHDLTDQVNTNMRSTIELVQGFAPGMIKNKWGRILTIGSVNQQKPIPDFVIYAATKSAVLNIVQNLAKQLAPSGITVNNIAPGAMDTDRNKAILSDKKYLEKVCSEIPAGFIGKASDCAGAALLLCSNAGRYITGADIYIDGGISLK